VGDEQNPQKHSKTSSLPLPGTTVKSNNIQDACRNTEVYKILTAGIPGKRASYGGA